MNYRVLTNWEVTGEITEQYFATFGDADTVVDYLKRALENGAKVSWRLQEKTANSFETVDRYGYLGEWENLYWPD